MNLISLPSGKIINLDLVAFVAAARKPYENEPKRDEGARLTVAFAAAYNTAKGGVPLHLELSGNDVPEFLRLAKGKGVDVEHLTARLNEGLAVQTPFSRPPSGVKEVEKQDMSPEAG